MRSHPLSEVFLQKNYKTEEKKMQKNNQNTYSDDIFDDTLVFHHFQSNEKSS
jgi:hypothetical protein